MRRIRHLFKRLVLRFLPARPSRPEDIPRRLGEQALADALREAAYLRGRHAVEVKTLAPDEIPGLPRRADE